MIKDKILKMEFTDRIAYIQSKLDEYYSISNYKYAEVESEIDDFDVLINIKVYSSICPTDLEYFNSLVGKEYHSITFKVPYSEFFDYDYSNDPHLVVIYKF